MYNDGESKMDDERKREWIDGIFIFIVFIILAVFTITTEDDSLDPRVSIECEN